MGQRFIEGTVPSVIKQLNLLNENLERLNQNIETLLSSTDKDEGDESE
jgi:prefoldin subunit 5